MKDTFAAILVVALVILLFIGSVMYFVDEAQLENECQQIGTLVGLETKYESYCYIEYCPEAWMRIDDLAKVWGKFECKP